MGFFVLVYDRRNAAIEALERFENSDDSLRSRSRYERQHADSSDVEVVVLVAESEDELRRTHKRYFLLEEAAS